MCWLGLSRALCWSEPAKVGMSQLPRYTLVFSFGYYGRESMNDTEFSMIWRLASNGEGWHPYVHPTPHFEKDFEHGLIPRTLASRHSLLLLN